jgi:hypothetical protein
VKWVLIYWFVTSAGAFTGQAYFESRALCEKAHSTIAKGAIRAVCLMAGETEN